MAVLLLHANVKAPLGAFRRRDQPFDIEARFAHRLGQGVEAHAAAQTARFDPDFASVPAPAIQDPDQLGFVEIEPSVFDNVNLKQIFSSQFDRPTLKVTQRVSLTEPEPSVQSIIGVSPGDQCMVLTLIALSHDGAYSFQEAFIPKSRFLLEMSLSGEGAVG